MSATDDQIKAARRKVRNMLHAADHGNHLGEMAVLRMAASDDLLATLIRVVAIADRRTDEFDAARAAIAKATGEAQ